ncbi:hypothetical protein GBO34_00960 [Roseivirga pacifica]|uniref:hypothetical protein n=1 Tax=Roseivirga pacifica TaxID=1267423 RepID=UPI0020952CC7|nr:hypothetical protein [Roseivirga pacifica]MCO6367883.1 hypothetical protein [Roseivirga pacifica]MCO6377255.1 hypothetical protein [Roseivirga pacifica]
MEAINYIILAFAVIGISICLKALFNLLFKPKHGYRSKNTWANQLAIKLGRNIRKLKPGYDWRMEDFYRKIEDRK